MSEIAIKVEGLSKKYLLNRNNGGSSDTLLGSVIASIKGSNTTLSDFWALKGINFEIKKGDRVGIIGRNGAGKSTLLKILSRVVKPTEGRIEYEGRMASLLEVGTGFHGDLSGRENIYLNGSILGMSKFEINKKFDEIVAFSEIEQFLDTPVKRYSSGMYVRLAFSVAAHLNPDILIVDEVLAVGDSVFQKKCIDKMADISREGRTILFVSHNFATINSLCDKAILLDKGNLVMQDSVSNVFNFYYSTIKINTAKFDLTNLQRNEYKQEIIFKEIGFEQLPIKFGQPIVFNIKLKSNVVKTFTDLDFGFNFTDKNYNVAYHLSNRFINKSFNHSNDDAIYQIECENNLKPGVYNLILFLRCADEIQDFLINKVSVDIEDGNPYGYNNTESIQGIVLPNFDIRTL